MDIARSYAAATANFDSELGLGAVEVEKAGR